MIRFPALDGCKTVLGRISEVSLNVELHRSWPSLSLPRRACRQNLLLLSEQLSSCGEPGYAYASKYCLSHTRRTVLMWHRRFAFWPSSIHSRLQQRQIPTRHRQQLTPPFPEWPSSDCICFPTGEHYGSAFTRVTDRLNNRVGVQLSR